MNIALVIQQIVFYVFALLTIGSAWMVVISRNPVKSALFLVLAFFGSAGLWLLLQAEFLALILILVYVGAVMTLFLFVVMMLNVDIAVLKRNFVRYLPLGLLLAVLIIALMIYISTGSAFSAKYFAHPAAHSVHYSNIQALGAVLYTRYVYAFEIAAVILLVALIAALGLALTGPRSRRSQRIHDQVSVRAKDRFRLVKVQAQSKGEGA